MIPLLKCVYILSGILDELLSWKVYELFVLGPIILRIRVPVHCELLQFQHWEWSLLLLLIVNVDEDSLKVIVCHRVVECIQSEPKAELMIPSAYKAVFKSYVDISCHNPQVLWNYASKPLHVAFILGCFLYCLHILTAITSKRLLFLIGPISDIASLSLTLTCSSSSWNLPCFAFQMTRLTNSSSKEAGDLSTMCTWLGQKLVPWDI